MAKRYVEECDLCKKEAELDNSLTIKPNKGKKAGRSYDLCDECKEALERALISRDGLRAFAKSIPVATREAPRNSNPIKEDDHTLVLPDGTTRDIPSRKEIARGAEDDPGAFAQPVPQAGDGDCLHMNRTPPRISQDSNKVMQECRDCHASLPYKSARQKAQEINVKPHAGVALKDHHSEERKRDD